MNIPQWKEGKGLTVCVTGAGGYIGSWLVKTLLENGFTVHATLRDPGNPSKNSCLLSLPGAHERLRLFRADLCEDGSFDSAIHGCQGVFHTASPTDSESQDAEKELTEAAVTGTLNVLKSCATTESVRRVVYTSSASAAFFLEKPMETIDESCWSSVDFIRQNKPPGWMYYVSKTLADQAAMQFAKENKMEVVSILPVIVAGPWLTTGVPASVDVTMSLITGNRNLHEILKWIGTSFVHIEDLCRAHLFLMEKPAVGERYICSAHSTTLSFGGAGGYIGSWLVKTLLENGFTVHATLRDPGNPSKNSCLLSLPGAHERLRLFRADLCEDGSFDSAIHGCQGVFHTASPTDSESQDPEKELTEAAVTGTLNVLKSCATTKSVWRVVYTSSASAAFFLEKPMGTIDESCWSSVDFIRQNKPPGWMYYVSKTLADQAAMQFDKENKMEVVSILPVIVAGPWLTTGVPASVDVTMSLITEICMKY